jgi:hypothetical protein
MPRVTVEMRAEIRAIARERVALRHQLDTLRLDYGDLFDRHLWQRDKPRKMVDLATEIEETFAQLQAVGGGVVAKRFGIAPSKVSQVESGRLYLRSME